MREPRRQRGPGPINISLICKHLSHHTSHPACLVTLPRILESALTPPLPSKRPFENYFQCYSFSGCSFIPSLCGIPPSSSPSSPPPSFLWICSLLLPGCQKSSCFSPLLQGWHACTLPRLDVCSSHFRCHRLNLLLCGSCPYGEFPSLTPYFQLHSPFLCFAHKNASPLYQHTAHTHIYMHAHIHMYIHVHTCTHKLRHMYKTDTNSLSHNHSLKNTYCAYLSPPENFVFPPLLDQSWKSSLGVTYF